VQYTEDKAITEGAYSLNNRIYQHVEYYYHRNILAGQSATLELQSPELRDHRSRHAAIRQHIAKTIIESIIREGRDKYELNP